jgi:hypothetical protein
MPRVDLILPAFSAGALPIFGSGYMYSYTSDIFSTTADTFQSSFKCYTSNLDTGIYRIGWYYIWSYDSTFDDIEIRIVLDETMDILNPFHREEPSDSSGNAVGGTDQRHISSGVSIIALDQGIHNLDLKIRSTKKGTCASIYSVRFELWRVG